ncbi:MAG: hypothetical protein JXA20_10620 [Spirochaetes bacterium]|nr:hypothetical protein [Spirochaetota bacterium]
MATTSPTGELLTGSKKKLVFAILGAALLLAGSFLAVDWMVYLYGIRGNLYPGIAKPCLTLLSMVLVLMIGSNCLDRRDRTLLILAFCCMLPTDVIMSAVVLIPGMTVGGWLFMAGGVLSILAHICLIVRFGRGFPYFKKEWRDANGIASLWSVLWPGILILASAVLVMAVLWDDILRVGHQVIGPVYTAFFCATAWLAWLTVRFRLYPAPNAWMAALAATCWYLTEITGEIYNIGIGEISLVMFRIVWVFYGTTVVLMALSGFRWTRE